MVVPSDFDEMVHVIYCVVLFGFDQQANLFIVPAVCSRGLLTCISIDEQRLENNPEESRCLA